jgi:hypothetical protein
MTLLLPTIGRTFTLAFIVALLVSARPADGVTDGDLSYLDMSGAREESVRDV